MSTEQDRFRPDASLAVREADRDNASLSRAGILFAVLGVIGSIGAWFIMLPLLGIILGIAVMAGWSPQQTMIKTFSRIGIVVAVIGVIGLAIFSFLWAVCAMNEFRL